MCEYRRDIHRIRQVAPAPRVRVAQGNIQVQMTVIRYSVLWQCWLGDRKDIRSVKVGWWFVVVTIWLKFYSLSTNALSVLTREFRNGQVDTQTGDVTW